jgi:hypothetical protein
MWTWEVSTATKRMSRVHCCKRHGLRANQQRTDRQRHTVLIGAIGGTSEVPCSSFEARARWWPKMVHDATRTRDK